MAGKPNGSGSKPGGVVCALQWSAKQCGAVRSTQWACIALGGEDRPTGIQHMRGCTVDGGNECIACRGR